LAGIAGATYTTATAYIADISSTEERAARFGMIGAAFGIGFVLGPALGGVAAQWDVTAPFWIAAVLAALNVCFGLFVLPESLAIKNRRAFGRRDLNPFKTIVEAFKIKGLFGWSTLLIGLSLAGYGVLLACVQGGLLPVFIRQFGEYRTLQLGVISAIVGFVGFGLVSSVVGLILVLLMAALSDLSPPMMTAMAANMVGEDKQGLVQGVIASLSSIAAFLAPLTATFVFDAYVDDVGLYLPGAPFLVSGALLMLTIPLVIRLRHFALS